MGINLMWWEHEQLLDHLLSRTDIWSSPRQNMWMRILSDKDDTPVIGLAISPPAKTGPYRQYSIRQVPMAWTVEQCDEYLDHLCRKWTDYGTRLRYASFLVSELALDPAKAYAAAIGLCGVEQIGDTDPEQCPMPTDRELWPDVEGPDLHIQHSERVLRTFGITGGGWLSVRLQSGMLRVRCALRSDGKYGGGYSGSFEGFIRPVNGNAELAAAFLYGTTVSTHGTVEYGDSGPLPLRNDMLLSGDKYVWNGLSKDKPTEQGSVVDGSQLLDITRPSGCSPTPVGGEEDIPKPE